MKKSFIQIAEDSDFPIQNLPYGVFRKVGEEKVHTGVALGDQVVSLVELDHAGLLHETGAGGGGLFETGSLNAFMAVSKEVRVAVRARLTELLDEQCDTLRDNVDLRERAIIPMADVEMLLPVEIGDYTDFYASREHATNVGTMFRGKENALMPNWLHLPVGYHGRASSIVVDGTPIHRPMGQTKADDAEMPAFGPCRLLDFELEMGMFVGTGNSLGEAVSVDDAMEHLFGMVLVNDWSARDIQKWEYVPLGPFLAKNFATTISPWVVTMEALEPFRVQAVEQSPEPLPYLKSSGSRETYDIHLEVGLKTEAMEVFHPICRSNFKHLYWTPDQFVAHHTVTGCNLQTGDLLASGTISGPTEDSYGSMLELSWRGSKALPMPDGSERKFLKDGDTVNMRAWCQGEGYRIGFGNCSAQIKPAKGE